MNSNSGKRLNKFISDSGFCSRREADKLIENNRVTINGQIPNWELRLLPKTSLRLMVSRSTPVTVTAPIVSISPITSRWGSPVPQSATSKETLLMPLATRSGSFLSVDWISPLRGLSF
ncbi:S4 domain-containing protein [Dongshaea marina]|uniref:S4 domain-containing protein n=1 Tax=Dongshaea marina TaxID=2047966 RepID=UPI001F48C00E|nr:S4 domain-containing protein [Dongshaea marina]